MTNNCVIPQSSATRIIAITVFLIGILMGALDNSILLPARLLIQSSFKITPNASIWMITLYTLVSAVSMPLVSKLSDKHGRKLVFIIAISVFGFGSLLVGLTNILPFFNNYPIFLACRFIQAVGAGGLVPIATAEISYSFPPEKRGFALGMIGGAYGMASVLGPTLGSFILDIAGGNNWGWLFFVNIPLTFIAIILSSKLSMPAEKQEKSFDILGGVVLAITVTSLLYALTNLNFFDFRHSLSSTLVYPYLLVFALVLPILLYIESKAADPILNLKYFKNPEIVKIFILSFLVGIRFMFIIFIPQYAENTLMLKTGAGGYIVTLLAIFSGASSPVCGRLIDKYGAKVVLGAGFVLHIIGFAELAFLVPHYMNLPTLMLGFLFVGTGMGFTLGAPLNYLMLKEVPKEESATGLAALSLIRSIGITLSPGILIGFVANAGKNVFPNLQKLFPMLKRTNGSGATSNEAIKALFENTDTSNIMDKVKTLIPSDVLDKIDWMLDFASIVIKESYQKTMNEGFCKMFLTVAILSAVALFVLIFLKKKPAQ